MSKPLCISIAAALLAFLSDAAVDLSLTSTNKYSFTRPAISNVVGRGMGKTVSYAVPRYEDIAFLREALAERICLLCGKTNIADAVFSQSDLVSGGLAFEDGNLARVSGSSNYCAGAFAPSFGRWDHNVRGMGWAQMASFVSPSFGVPTTAQETGSDYLVNGKPTDGSLKAFVDENDAISRSLLFYRWDEGITNNTLRGIPQARVIAGVYSNVCIRARVIHDAYEFATGDTRTHPLTSLRTINTYDTITNWISESYSYVSSRGTTEFGTYRTGYHSTGPVRTEYCSTNTDHFVDTYRMSMSSTKETHLPYDYKYADYGLPKKYRALTVGDPLHYRSETNIRAFDTAGRPIVRSDFLDVATNYVNEADCLIVLRLSVISRETISGSTSAAMTSASTNHWVLTKNTTIRKRDDSSMWEVDFDLATISPVFDDGWVAGTRWPVIDRFNDEYMDTVPQSLSATHERRQGIGTLDIQLYVNFIPVFRARVLE